MYMYKARKRMFKDEGREPSTSSGLHQSHHPGMLLPMPRCPLSLLPQHLTPPPVAMMQVWPQPHAMAVAETPGGREEMTAMRRWREKASSCGIACLCEVVSVRESVCLCRFWQSKDRTVQQTRAKHLARLLDSRSMKSSPVSHCRYCPST